MTTNKAETVRLEMAESEINMALVTGFWTSLAYEMVAMAAAVIGKVYAHHANENLQSQTSLIKWVFTYRDENT